MALIDLARLYHQPYITEQQLLDLTPVVLANLSLLEFGKVVDIFCLYHKRGVCSEPLAELLKFDLLRKLNKYSKFRGVMRVLLLIEKGHIQFREFKL